MYVKLKGEKVKVTWDTVIWNGLTVPKYRFIIWLAIQERLQTTSKLAIMGVSASD